MTERSLFLIKPNAVANGHIGDIVSIIERHKFRIINIKIITFNPELSRRFYADHLGKEFYQRLESFMCSGNTIALLLEKENAIAELREIMGDVMPEKRKPGTIRALYGEGVTNNGAHASDSVKNAQKEIQIIFGD
ncbi:MAG: nucleoside-diphosphate kinase [Candidatus Cloacimonetes bacterium]|nr:nucleoside-diphosphate kinase [Candidatus Cloacimonadota bacterium]MDD3282879.1 nucleoside-diphosphate kinase [Candidatus Cloacimonadota bacterium]MDD4231998.1 nucleoside-diphosphate kinase [Candidatus Cloacimonadota bacterium]MDD4687476.1 nucleoside-diphosphate kinase [Candidatus Cloacimonadota bacterium]